MKLLLVTLCLMLPNSFNAQTSSVGSPMPPIEPGVSQELAKWRAAHYSDVRYKLNLTLEKMSPVLKGTMEIRVHVKPGTQAPSPASPQRGDIPPIILDWRRIRGHEDKSTISNVTINGTAAVRSSSFSWPPVGAEASPGSDGPPKGGTPNFGEYNEHLIFRDGVVAGENVIKLDFTSPILTSGSAITRYVDKEDGSEYLYSLFVPSDASTAFPVFDQPDLKARFQLATTFPEDWVVVANMLGNSVRGIGGTGISTKALYNFEETKPISTYVFAFAAGPFEKITGGNLSGSEGVSSQASKNTLPTGRVSASGDNTPSPIRTEGQKEDLGDDKRIYREWRKEDVVYFFPPSKPETSIYVRKSQAEKFKPHAAEVFRLNREAVRYFEEYFDYKFPFPKYDLVLIPEFPFGGMEHAGATFLRESAIIFPQEPTKNDHISRATLIFHEAAHQWFGDTVTMRWFDDLWLKEGFATFTAYKAMERIMPEMLAWKVFYERVKQAAYQTDSTRGTTPIYQEIPNLSAAKSAYGNIVYNKAPAFLRQAEFYLGEDKFQAGVRAFLKKHEFGNAGWEDLVKEFETATEENHQEWAKVWITKPGVPIFKGKNVSSASRSWYFLTMVNDLNPLADRVQKIEIWDYELSGDGGGIDRIVGNHPTAWAEIWYSDTKFYFPNESDYGYGIFLLDEKSRDYVLKNIQNEKDPFLRSMIWGALWDSVREGELDPREYVELVVRVLSTTPAAKPATPPIQEGSLVRDDESTTALLLNRVGTGMNYYIDEAGTQAPSPASARRAENTVAAESVQRPADAVQAGRLRSRVEDLLIERMQNADTLGQRITFYRAFLNVASSEKARGVLKGMLKSEPPASAGGQSGKSTNWPAANAAGSDNAIPVKTKDKFDIVTRLLILGDPDAERLLAEVEKTETTDDAKRYAYAARAGIGTAENKAKYWNDFVNNKEISESWIEAAFGPWNSIRHSELTLPYLERALKELPNHKRNRKIFFVNGWLGAFIGGQRSEKALGIINKFLAENPTLDNDLRLKILENSDIIERAVRIRKE